MKMTKAGTETGTQTHKALLVTVVSTGQSHKHKQFGNPPLLYVALLLAHGYLTENIMCMSKVGHAQLVYTAGTKGAVSRISLWNLLSNICSVRGASMLL